MIINLPNEEWKDIPDYEGFYQGSTRGRVKSLERVIIRNNGRRQYWRERILVQNPCTDGRMQVGLTKNGKTKPFIVSVLIAKLFLDYFEGCEVHHKDRDWMNNSVDNLICLTKEEHYAIHHNEKCEKNVRVSSKTVLQCDPVSGEVVNEFSSAANAGKFMGVSRSGISSCCRGVYKTYAGFIWRYKDAEAVTSTPAPKVA